MILPLQKFSLLLENMAAAVQGGSAQLVDLSVGSVLRALLEASAAVALWMQWLILQVLSVTRAATSTGMDLDSWMADFSLARLPGSPSGGSVTFFRYTPGVATTVLLGALMRTNDGTQSFSVVQDSSNAAWNGSSGYTVAASASGVTVPVVAQTAGSAGNVQSGAISVLSTAIPGIDGVFNPGALAGGVDTETDAAFRSRFLLYINSRSAATAIAIDFAVSNVQQGLRYVVLENVNTAGLPQKGAFWVIVDDGSGTASDDLLTRVSTAVDQVRPLGATYAVTPPSILPVSVSMTLITSNPATKAAVTVEVQQMIVAWIGALPIAATLAVSKLEALAHAVDASVVSVASVSINGSSYDVTADASQVIIATTVVVN